VALGGGGHHHQPADALGERLGVPVRVLHHGHPAQRVADEDDRAVRHHVVDHRGEVVGELGERGRVPGDGGRAAVTAGVVRDEPGRHPDLVEEPGKLPVPGTAVERPAVQEDHRHPGVALAVDLPVQARAVVEAYLELADRPRLPAHRRPTSRGADQPARTRE
jgi:hypothetical protein